MPKMKPPGILISIIFAFLLSFISCITDKTIVRVEEIQRNSIIKLYGKDTVPFPTNAKVREKLYESVLDMYNNVQGQPFMKKEEIQTMVDSIYKKKPKTKYQDLESYFILSDLINNIQLTNDSSKLFYKNVHPRYFTLWTNEINAEAKKINNEYVIFYNKRIFDFCMLMSKIALTSVKFQIKDNTISFTNDLDLLKDNIRENNELQNRFIHAILEFKYNEDPIPYILDSEYNSILQSLFNSMEFFIMSHEYTHVEFEHSHENKFSAKGEIYDNEDTTMFKLRTLELWKNEIIGDIYGQLMLNNYSNINNHIYFRDFKKSGSYFYFKCADVLDKSIYLLENSLFKQNLSTNDSTILCESLINYINKDSTNLNLNNIPSSILTGNHPPYEIRNFFISTILQKEIDKEIHTNTITKEQLFIYDLGRNMSYVIDFLYEITKNKILILSKMKNEKH